MELGKKLERVQNYGITLILSKPPKTHSEELQEELGWRTLAKRRSMVRMMLDVSPTSLCERVRMVQEGTRRSMTNFIKNHSASGGSRTGTAYQITAGLLTHQLLLR